MANETDKVEAKRERVEELRAEIAERAAQRDRELAERTQASNEERLDREIAQLEMELTRMDQADAFAKGEKPGSTSVENMTVDEIKKLPEYDSIEGRSDMNKDALVDAVVEARKEGK